MTATPYDMSDRVAEQARQLIARTVEECGRIDILINNAGKGSHAPLRTMGVGAYSAAKAGLQQFTRVASAIRSGRATEMSRRHG